MWYALLDGEIAFGTYAKSQKVLNLRRDPRITVMIETGVEYNEVRGLVIEGQAEIIDGNADPCRARPECGRGRHQPTDLPTGEMPEQALKAASKRSVIVVHPTSVYSWDHRKLGGVY